MTKEDLIAQGRAYADDIADRDVDGGGPDPEHMLDGCIPFYNSNQLRDAFVAGALWQHEHSKQSEQ